MSRLLKLFALNAKNSHRKFEVKAEGDEATIYLYDSIVSDDFIAEWWGGVSATSFVLQLNQITAPVIHLRINCPGGDVFGARVMEQAIRQHKAKVIAHIDGYAASAASFLAIACDEVRIAKGGFVMIHKAWSISLGNADDLRKDADLLDKIDESLVTSYEEETGQPPEQIRSWMADETWFSADDALKYGFADSIAETKAKANWDMSVYDKAPQIANAEDTPPAPTEIQQESFIEPDHRVRQQQRMKVLAHTSIG
ncbi:head maturation protease, ClpP-related [Methylobacillus flagellatus]|uniref:head maturation protease, ClpP-related n=1 Tax=Methylobacillus flagellatus TaxID=405 RepID=UPI0010F82BB6|nr:head maturation protease, ClpP-related [Methylobacillus flagellatus]